MSRYKYVLTGCKYYQEAKKDRAITSFSVVFGKPNMEDKTAIEEADVVFQNQLRAAKPGELVEMTLQEGNRVVKPYPPTPKE
jgi:hypothetical protein